MSTYNQRRQGGPANKKSTRRILELKSLVDRIINECTIESKEVRSGLQAIKDYQLDMLEEIRDIPEEEDDDASYAPRYRGYNEVSARPTVDQREYGSIGAYSENDRTVTALREELQAEARYTNKIAQSYRNLQGDYQKLRKQYEKLARKQQDQSSIEGEPRYTRQVESSNRVTREVEPPRREAPARSQSRERPAEYVKAEARPRASTTDNEVARLKEELRAAHNQIHELERRLASANEQIARLRSQKNPDSRSHTKLLKQLELLKQHNDQLRKQTINLLKNNPNSSQLSQLQEQVTRLYNQIQKQNVAKQVFVKDLQNYKKRLNDLEDENRRLKSNSNQSQYTLGNAAYATSDYNYDSYAYNSSVPVFGSNDDTKINKYKSFLSNLQSSYT